MNQIATPAQRALLRCLHAGAQYGRTGWDAAVSDELAHTPHSEAVAQAATMWPAPHEHKGTDDDGDAPRARATFSKLATLARSYPQASTTLMHVDHMAERARGHKHWPLSRLLAHVAYTARALRSVYLDDEIQTIPVAGDMLLAAMRAAEDDDSDAAQRRAQARADWQRLGARSHQTSRGRSWRAADYIQPPRVSNAQGAALRIATRAQRDGDVRVTYGARVVDGKVTSGIVGAVSE